MPSSPLVPVDDAAAATLLPTPSISLESPGGNMARQGTCGAGGSTSRGRSLSPPPASSFGAVVSPRTSRIFASRPSPVVPSPSVPASPSYSRPTSPRPPRDRLDDPPSSPTRSQRELPVSASALTVDLSHIFERDVEFSSTHQLTTQEAVDVAIPPALDEAVLASEDLDEAEIASIVRESGDAGSGWSSPITPAPLLHHGQPYADASRSPTRSSGNTRSFSPDFDSASSGRATSPESSASFSIGTPGSSPPGASAYMPFTQHLADALESEARKVKPALSLGVVNPNGSHTTIPFPSVSSATTPSDSGPGQLPSLPSSGSIDSLGDRRRLSFMSLADVINEERMAELTGTNGWDAQTGAPSRSVGGGALDLGEVALALPHIAPS